MSQPIKVNWTCECKHADGNVSGYIDADTDSVRCNNCDGIIAGTEHLTVEELQKYNDAYMAWVNAGDDDRQDV